MPDLYANVSINEKDRIMITTPKSLRLQIGIFGRTNVGKSSFLNAIAGQDVAITSPHAGTTTDVVEKPMELLPIGPVVFLDTAGLDDVSEMGSLRIERTKKIFQRADVIVIVTTPGIWGHDEDEIVAEAKKRNTPVITVINKVDLEEPELWFLETIRARESEPVLFSSTVLENRESYAQAFLQKLISCVPDDFLDPPALLGDLLPAGGVAVFVVPIDLQAPKGRLILPQVQAIRDILDSDAMTLVVKEREYAEALRKLASPPDLVVCDSQVVQKVAADTPEGVKFTTFSTLFARYKGDFIENVRALAVIDTLVDGDRVLIAEACSHHALEDDIGRVKIPRWLKQYTGRELIIETVSGRDFPDDLEKYRLIVQCGSCMLTRREVLARISTAKVHSVGITNYGLCISFLQGVIKRVLTPFPAALDAFEFASIKK